jgi:predicted nucleic acid-binding protein
MGLIVLDAGPIIAVLNSLDAHHGASQAALKGARLNGHSFVVPASVYAEILVDPFRAGDRAATEVDRFLGALSAAIEPASPAIAKAAARLRARHNRLRLPDALAIATAELVKAEAILTTDARWPRIQGVEIRVLGTAAPQGA